MNGFGAARTRQLPAGCSTLGWIDGNVGENRVVSVLRSEGIEPGFNGVAGVLACFQQFQVGPYVLDFAWPKLKIALEADGSAHRIPAQIARDRKREAWLRARGWLVLRVDTVRSDDAAKQVRRVLSVVRSLARS